MRVLLPNSLSEALTMLESEPAPLTPIAGGTDAMVHWPVRLDAKAASYLDLSALTELRHITWTSGHLILGGLATYWDLIRDPRAAAEFPLLITAARQVGAIQIQTRGTWAGNIVNASPAADGVPALMALDAELELTSAGGKAERIRLDSFYSGYKKTARRPDQLVTAIRIPRRDHDLQLFEKVGARRAQTITKVGAAIAHSAAGWRIAVNSVAPTVRRLRTLEAALDGSAKHAPVRSPRDLEPLVAPDISPIDDIRSTSVYRRAVLCRLLYHHLIGHAALIPGARP